MGSATGIICVQQSNRLEELFSSSAFSLNTLLQPLWQIVGILPAREPASQCSRLQKYGAIQHRMCGLQRRFRWLWWAVHMSAETSARRYPIRKVMTPVPVEGGRGGWGAPHERRQLVPWAQEAERVGVPAPHHGGGPG
jgi:hypothetical protein